MIPIFDFIGTLYLLINEDERGCRMRMIDG